MNTVGATGLVKGQEDTARRRRLNVLELPWLGHSAYTPFHFHNSAEKAVQTRLFITQVHLGHARD